MSLDAAVKPVKVGVVGSGVWGAAFGRAVASEHCRVLFWDRDVARARAVAEGREFCGFCAGDELPVDVDLIVLAVSSVAFADVLGRLASVAVPVVWLTKGFDPVSREPLYAVAQRVLGSERYGVISGPSFAEEVERGLPAALSLAMCDVGEAERVQGLLHRPRLRLYVVDDVVGVCVGGAVKNVVAIAAGICDGLRLGENARAALIARGLAEMGAICVALGGRAETLLGLCGVGDLALTCCSDLSRNRRLGLRIATGEDNRGGGTFEGAAAAASVAACARGFGIEVPIIDAVAEVLEGRLSPAAAVEALLARPPR